VRLLVPIDGYPPSMRALDVAVEFAAARGGDVVICYVVDLAEVAVLTGGEAQLLPSCLEQAESRGNAILAAALSHVGSRVHVSTRRAEGEPVEEIERLAAQTGADIVVLGSHGRSGIARAVMGSVAEGVVRRAPIPVIVVPAKQLEAA